MGASLDGSYATAAAVRARLKEIVASAIQRGSLVVTFRPNALVLTVLESERPKLKEQGVEIVPVSQLAL